MVHFKKNSFPEVNPVQYNVHKSSVDKNKELKIQNYRWPSMIASTQPGYKGIVFFVHDFTDYIGRNAHVARGFAEHGYDFFGMDMRGHGKSEGMMAYFSNIVDLVDDLKGYMN